MKATKFIPETTGYKTLKPGEIFKRIGPNKNHFGMVLNIFSEHNLEVYAWVDLENGHVCQPKIDNFEIEKLASIHLEEQ